MVLLAVSGDVYACFWAGLILVGTGTLVGVILSFGKPATAPATAKAKINAAKVTVQDLAKEAIEAKKAPATAAAAPTESKASDAESLLKDAESVIDALPERLRFAGFLIVFGALLMSVAVVQFGGHSIF